MPVSVLVWYSATTPVLLPSSPGVPQVVTPPDLSSANRVVMIGPPGLAIDPATSLDDPLVAGLYHFKWARPYMWLASPASKKMPPGAAIMAANKADKDQVANVEFGFIIVKGASGARSHYLPCLRGLENIPIKEGDFLNVQYYGGTVTTEIRVAKEADEWSQKKMAHVRYMQFELRKTWKTAVVCEKCLTVLRGGKSKIHRTVCAQKRKAMEDAAGQPLPEASTRSSADWLKLQKQ